MPFVMLIITISHVSNALHQTLTSYKLVLLIPGHFTCYEDFEAGNGMVTITGKFRY